MLGSGYAVNVFSYPQAGDIVQVRLNEKQELRGIVLGVGEMYRIFVSISVLLQCLYIEVPRSLVTVEGVRYQGEDLVKSLAASNR
jgi:hypothetical protein